MEHPSKKSIAIVLVTVATCLVVVLCVVLGIAYGSKEHRGDAAATVNASDTDIANATLVGSNNAITAISGGPGFDTRTSRQAVTVWIYYRTVLMGKRFCIHFSESPPCLPAARGSREAT